MCKICNDLEVVIQIIAPPLPAHKQDLIGVLPGQEQEFRIAMNPITREYLRPCDCLLERGPVRWTATELVNHAGTRSRLMVVLASL